MTEQLDLPTDGPVPEVDPNHEYVARAVAYIRRLLTDRLPVDASSRARPQRSFGRSWSAPDAPPDAPPESETKAAPGQGPPDDADPLDFDGPTPALVALGERFGLNRFERDVVLLGTAVELDPSLRDLCARLHGNPAMRYPTFAIAMMALPDPHWTALSPDGPLRAHRLIDVEPATGESLVTAALAVDERLVNHIRGLDHLDARLRASVLSLDEVDIDSLPVSQRASADRVVARWTGHDDDAPYVQRLRVDRPALTPQPVAVELVGSDSRTAALLAGAVVDRFGLHGYRMSATSLPSDETQIDELARLWRREAGLSPVALYLEEADSHPPAARFAQRSGCACFLQLSQPPMLPGPASLRVEVAPPTTQERHAAWVTHLPQGSPADAGQLAAQFAVDTATIARLAAAAEDPWQQARQEARPRLEGLAERITPQASWPDLVLDDDKTALLHAIADQVRHRWQVYHQWELADRSTRGTGIAVLFAGPSGTGKTLAAEVLANDIGLDLYKADLAGIVSKYIGETEKNLRQLFDAAETGGGVLFIDEADALFGKRSEVKDSHDRFANTQTNYLLQRMESYQGVAILATNMRSALDTAFLRRLRFIVEFPFPEVAQRAAIWRASLPAEVPGVGELDLDRLAELPVNGGMIRNISVNAAFLAAAAGTDLSTEHVLQAVRNEFAKLQVPISERQLSGRQLTR